ncbi:Os09g0530350, partial [Oryza sativa Japonica Group]
LGDKAERDAQRRGQPGRLAHVQLRRAHAGGELPVEVVQEGDQRHLQHRHGEADAGADPPAGAERDELVVVPPEVHRRSAGQEPLRPELLRRAPRRGVPPDRPRVDEQRRPRRDLVPLHGRRRRRLVRDEDRGRRVQPEHLLHHRLHVLHAAHLRLRDGRLPAGRSSDLFLQLRHHPRVRRELRHGPFQRHRRRLGCGGDQILQ